jgi:hypothetical protein
MHQKNTAPYSELRGSFKRKEFLVIFQDVLAVHFQSNFMGYPLHSEAPPTRRGFPVRKSKIHEPKANQSKIHEPKANQSKIHEQSE